MDRDDDLPDTPTDLVQLLVLEAGRIMEEASPEFAMALPGERSVRGVKLDELINTSAVLHALLQAATRLNSIASSNSRHAGD